VLALEQVWERDQVKEQGWEQGQEQVQM